MGSVLLYSISSIKQDLLPLRRQLKDHPIYRTVAQPDQVRFFMAHHVYAVWDFMSLLKKLQQMLTATTVPWQPKGDPRIRRFINQIVLEEESDLLDDGTVMSHFELYLAAMQQAGVSTTAVERFCQVAAIGHPVETAAERAHVPEAAAAFVQDTFSFIDANDAASIAAAFTFGREEVIPDMFRALVAGLAEDQPHAFQLFHTYLVRHIELDGDSHSHLAEEMINLICGNREQAWERVRDAARKALQSRITLWDGVLAHMQNPVLDPTN